MGDQFGVGKCFGGESDESSFGSPFGAGNIILRAPVVSPPMAAPPPPPPPAPVVKHGFFWHLFHPGHKDA